jgi:sugar-specific transcriptional regulator TrmB
MIIQTEFLNDLKSFGLNSYETKLWVALLSVGTSTAGELSDIANVPRSRTYDVLEGLEKKGFIITRIGKPIKYLAIAPEEVLERIKQKIKKEHSQKENTMNTLKESEVMKNLELLYKQGVDTIEPTDISGSIKGRDKIYSHLNSMIRNAEKNILIITQEELYNKKILAINKTLTKAQNKGIDLQFYLSTNDTNKTKKQKNVIYTNKIDSRLCIVDDQEVLLMLSQGLDIHEDYDIAIWLKTPFLANSIRSMVEHAHKNF